MWSAWSGVWHMVPTPVQRKELLGREGLHHWESNHMNTRFPSVLPHFLLGTKLSTQLPHFTFPREPASCWGGSSPCRQHGGDMGWAFLSPLWQGSATCNLVTTGYTARQCPQTAPPKSFPGQQCGGREEKEVDSSLTSLYLDSLHS